MLIHPLLLAPPSTPNITGLSLHCMHCIRRLQVKTGGYVSFAELATYAVLGHYAASLVKDSAVLEQLPHVVRLFRNIKDLPQFQELPSKWLASDLGDPTLSKGERREEEKYLIKTTDNTATRLATSGIKASEVLCKISAGGCSPVFDTPDLDAAGLSAGAAWAKLHAQLDPKAGDLSITRAERKRQQIDNLRAMVATVVKDGDVIVEFGAGGGHVGLVLAAVFPTCSVILLDRKRHSLARAQRRAAEMGLENVTTFYGDVAEFDQPFNIGVALHFCGFLTDLAQHKCIEVGAAYVLCPCCYGKIGMETVVADSAASGGTSIPSEKDKGGDGVGSGAKAVQPARLVSLPKSKGLVALGVTEIELIALTQHCDYGPLTESGVPAEDSELHDLCDPRWLEAKECMGVVDGDRNRWAEEHAGYKTRLFTMDPPTCSPKNNAIVGWRP